MKIELAKKFCIERHTGQFRKYTNEPYHVHPFEVFAIVKKVTDNEDMLITALLHDTVEDTNTTLDEIEHLFGKNVATLVENLTDISKKSDGNRKTRKKNRS